MNVYGSIWMYIKWIQFRLHIRKYFSAIILRDLLLWEIILLLVFQLAWPFDFELKWTLL